MACKNRGITSNISSIRSVIHIQRPQISKSVLYSGIYPLHCGGGLLLWQRCESKIWLDDAEVGEQGLGLLILDTGVDNDIVTRDPVDRGGDAMLVTSLQRVDNTKNLSSVSASRGGVREDEADCLLRINDENGSDSERNALGVDIGGVLVVKPAYRVSWNMQTALPNNAYMS
jgi:hypothetical protein